MPVLQPPFPNQNTIPSPGSNAYPGASKGGMPPPPSMQQPRRHPDFSKESQQSPPPNSYSPYNNQQPQRPPNVFPGTCTGDIFKYFWPLLVSYNFRVFENGINFRTLCARSQAGPTITLIEALTLEFRIPVPKEMFLVRLPSSGVRVQCRGLRFPTLSHQTRSGIDIRRIRSNNSFHLRCVQVSRIDCETCAWFSELARLE